MLGINSLNTIRLKKWISLVICARTKLPLLFPNSPLPILLSHKDNIIAYIVVKKPTIDEPLPVTSVSKPVVIACECVTDVWKNILRKFLIKLISWLGTPNPDSAAKLLSLMYGPITNSFAVVFPVVIDWPIIATASKNEASDRSALIGFFSL